MLGSGLRLAGSYLRAPEQSSRAVTSAAIRVAKMSRLLARVFLTPSWYNDRGPGLRYFAAGPGSGASPDWKTCSGMSRSSRRAVPAVDVAGLTHRENDRPDTVVAPPSRPDSRREFNTSKTTVGASAGSRKRRAPWYSVTDGVVGGCYRDPASRATALSVDVQRRRHPPPFARGLCDDVAAVVPVRAG